MLYEKRDDKLLITRDYHDNAFVMMGGGAMKSTLRDMERYLQLFLRRGEPLLSPDSFRRMTAAYVSYRPSVGYGYGLSVGQLAGYPVYHRCPRHFDCRSRYALVPWEKSLPHRTESLRALGAGSSAQGLRQICFCRG